MAVDQWETDTEELGLRERYRQLDAARTIQWEGREVRLSEPGALYAGAPARQRERIWRLHMERRLADVEALQGLWRDLLFLRQRRARQAGFADFVSYSQPSTYTEDDRALWHEAVEEWVSPVLVHLHEDRRSRQRTFRPWNLEGGMPWPPDSTDLDQSTVFPEASRKLLGVDPALQLPDELNELAVRTAELLAAVGLRAAPLRAGDATSGRGRRELILLSWARLAMVDAFEAWAYRDPEAAAGAEACRRQWRDLWLRFLPSVDWSGLEEWLTADWQSQSALFLRPLTAPGRSAAQLGAVQVWLALRHEDRGACLRFGRAVTSAKSVAQAVASVGAELRLDAHNLREAVDALLDV